MSSQPSKNTQARSVSKLLSREGRQDIVLSLLPVTEFREARGDLIDIFACAYEESDEISEPFQRKSLPDLREWAIEPYPRITEYDPHESVMRILRLAGELKRIVKTVLYLVGLIVAIPQLHELAMLAMDGITIADAGPAVDPLSVLAVVTIYVWLLRADTFVHRALARELRVGIAKVMTREESRIVGHGVWNRSLLGQTGLILTTVFFLLRSLGRLPLLDHLFDDPASYIKSIITENMDLFLDADGWVDAVRGLYQRHRRSLTG